MTHKQITEYPTFNIANINGVQYIFIKNELILFQMNQRQLNSQVAPCDHHLPSTNWQLFTEAKVMVQND